MSGALMFMPVLTVLLVVAVAGLLVRSRRRRVTLDEARYPALAHLGETTRRARWTGIAVGTVAAVVALLPGSWLFGGRGLLVAPLAFGAGLTLALILGDVLARGDARSASGPAAALAADPRRGRDILPPALTVAVGVVVAVLTALLAAGWTLGLRDVTGARPGSSLQWDSPTGVYGIGISPWPGSYYGRILIPAVILLLVLLAVGLVVTARRPRDGSDPVIAQVDALVRRREAEALLGATGGPLAVLTVVLAGIEAAALFGLASGIASAGLPVDPTYRVAGWLCVAAAVVALPVVVWCALAVIVPASAPRMRGEGARGVGE